MRFEKPLHCLFEIILLVFLVTPAPSYGFIAKLYSLKEVADASHVIVEGKIDSVDTKGKTAVARLTRGIKGKSGFTRIQMNIGVGQLYFPQVLLSRWKVGDPVIFFYQQDNKNRLACLGHCGDVWFQLFGSVAKDEGQSWWKFTHIEIYMNRTYAGTTPELIKLVNGIFSGKEKYPAPNTKLPALTKNFLLGKSAAKASTGSKKTETRVAAVKPAPSAAKEAIDGLEAKESWKVETWGNPAMVNSLESSDGRGKMLRIDYSEGDKKKIAVSHELEADFSKVKRLVFEAFHHGNKPVQICWAITTMPDSRYYESQPMPLSPGNWNYDVSLELAAENFKCEATKWEHKSAIFNRQKVSKLTLLIYAAASKGTLTVDRIRTDKGEMFARSIPLDHTGGEARGVCWVDVDSDGDLDAYICSERTNRLYRNEGGELKDVTGETGLSGGSRCAAWADYDGDGDLDLFTSSLALWTNNDGKFQNDSKLLPKQNRVNTEGAGWMDANGDGHPDILVSNGEMGILLFLNQGKGPDWFKSVNSEWGLGQKGIGSGNGDFLSIADFDGDGYSDFLYNFGRGVLGHNEDGETFTLAKDSGVSYAAGNSYKLGAAFGDYDNDGDLDLFVPQRGKSRLFRNNNDFTFTNSIDGAGDLAGMSGTPRTAAWGDLNGDGTLDLLVGFSNAPLRLFLNQGRGTFTELTHESGLDGFDWTTSATGLVLADWDNDGDLDILVTGETTHSGVIINNAPKQLDQSSAIKVRLPRNTCPGTLVRLYDKDGKIMGIQQVGTVNNFSAQGPPEAVFFVRPGEYKISALLTNGDLKQKTLKIKGNGALWTPELIATGTK